MWVIWKNWQLTTNIQTHGFEILYIKRLLLSSYKMCSWNHEPITNIDLTLTLVLNISINSFMIKLSKIKNCCINSFMMKIKKETKIFVKDFQTALQKKKFSLTSTSEAAENVYHFPFTSLSVSFEIHSPITISK